MGHRSIYKELRFDEHGFRDHQADTARIPESGKRNDSMEEKDNEIAHLSIVTNQVMQRIVVQVGSN